MTRRENDERCPLPFIQLLLSPRGSVRPCCFNQDFEITRIDGMSFDEIWNHPRLVQMRREILEGNFRMCAEQIQVFKCNRYFDRFRDQVDWSEVQRKPPIRMDVRLNGQCNIECVMCEVWKEPNQLYDASFFWSEGPERIFPFLKSILVLGGEPFIQRDTYRLIDEITRVNGECHFNFFTNGQWKFTPAIKSSLDKLDKLSVNLSLDSVNSGTYERVRLKGSFEKVMRNLDEWRAYQDVRGGERPFQFQISFLISQANWREIPEMFLFSLAKQVEPQFQFLQIPNELSLSSLPEREKKEAFDQIEAWSRAIPGMSTVDWSEAARL